jgi:hypothetical protein
MGGHSRFLVKEHGLTEDEVKAARAGAEPEALSEREKVLIRFARRVAERPRQIDAEDIAALRATGVKDFYLYDADRDPVAAWALALAGLEGVRVFGHTTLVGRAKASGFDGLYTYDVVTWNGALFKRLCTQAHRVGLLCAPSVGPGFDARLATRVDAVRPRLRGATYDRMWKTALRAQPDLLTITSYNEWQEGTQIEPAQSQVGKPGYDGAWGALGAPAQRAYLDATARWTARLRVLNRR